MQQNRILLSGIVISLLLLGSGVSFVLIEQGAAEENRAIYVKESYPYETGDGSANRPYRSIQKAIDLASDGDSIYVFEGIYNESLTIDKRVNISGLDRKNTTIQKSGVSYRYLIDISADNVALEDINITDVTGSIRTALIHVTADNVRIVGVRVTHGKKWGIYLDGSSDGIIGYSTIDNMSDSGIYAQYSDNNVFSNNLLHTNRITALYLSSCDNNIIYNNTIKNTNLQNENGNAIDIQHCTNGNVSKNTIINCSLDGIHIYGGSSNLVQGNNIKWCDRQGIYIGSSDSTILENTLTSDQFSVTLASSNCQVSSNIIKSSVQIGLTAQTGTLNNIIWSNQFTLNGQNAKELGNNQWDYQGIGNYWSDYNEGDRDGNGIGDAPYTRMGGIDHYPTGKFLLPPNKPATPSPTDNQSSVGLSVTLSVTVSDPDSQTLSVYFYNASNNQTLGYQSGVKSGERAYCSFNLEFQTTLFWYTTVSDGKLENRSDIWFFTTRQIPPTNEKPIANPGGPYITKMNQSVSFNGSQSRDDGTIIFYRWNFGDGSSQILDKTPKHTYINPGVYTVTLTVVDNDGRSSMANTIATIQGAIYYNSPPVAVFTALSSVSVNQPVSFDASGSNDTDGTIVGYRWDFDSDGTFDTDWLNATVTTHAFSSVGSSIVTLEVKDDGNATGSFSTTIAVNAVQKKTPGFDIILVFFAVLVGLLIYNKQRK